MIPRSGHKLPPPIVYQDGLLDKPTELALERLRYGMTNYLLPEMINDMRAFEIEPFIRDQLDILMYGFEVTLYGQTLEDMTVRYPRDWWEAVKDRFAPGWVLARWPVVYTVHEIKIHALVDRIKFPLEMGSQRLVMDYRRS